MSSSTAPPAAGSGVLVGRPRWTPDEEANECHSCGVAFNLFVRKHHCRACGHIFCDDDSRWRVPLTDMGYEEPQRVCQKCHQSHGRNEFKSADKNKKSTI